MAFPRSCFYFEDPQYNTSLPRSGFPLGNQVFPEIAYHGLPPLRHVLQTIIRILYGETVSLCGCQNYRLADIRITGNDLPEQRF